MNGCRAARQSLRIPFAPPPSAHTAGPLAEKIKERPNDAAKANSHSRGCTRVCCRCYCGACCRRRTKRLTTRPGHLFERRLGRYPDTRDPECTPPLFGRAIRPGLCPGALGSRAGFEFRIPRKQERGSLSFSFS